MILNESSDLCAFRNLTVCTETFHPGEAAWEIASVRGLPGEALRHCGTKRTLVCPVLDVLGF